MTRFGERLRELRKQRGMSQRKLAEQVGVDYTYLSKIENEQMPPPSAATIHRIGQALDADEGELLLLAGKVAQLWGILEALVQTNGVAHCYDRYCHDDEWTYCIFCEEGDFDPHTKPGWQHKPDCLVVKARTLLDISQTKPQKER